MRAAKAVAVINRSQRGRGRGFTLVELMIVVAVVGVLAVIALVGFRKYQISAASGDARAVLQSIRGGEDAYKAETLTYLTCSPGLTSMATAADYYPQAPTGAKMGWPLATSSAASQCWATLNISTSAPTRFGYEVIAGDPGTVNAGNLPTSPGWPYATASGTTSANPWFVAAALGDYDHDGTYSMLYTSSLNGDVVVVEDTE